MCRTNFIWRAGQAERLTRLLRAVIYISELLFWMPPVRAEKAAAAAQPRVSNDAGPTPEEFLLVSMLSLLALGMLAQTMQSWGCRRAAPIVTLSILFVICIGGMVMLSRLLENTPDWQVATHP